MILRFGNPSFLWCCYFFYAVDLTNRFVWRVIPSFSGWARKKNMIQNFKCPNCRFTFKFDTTINFLLINDMNMQISRTISKECCSHTHMSQFCDLEIRRCLRNKHTEAGSGALQWFAAKQAYFAPWTEIGQIHNRVTSASTLLFYFFPKCLLVVVHWLFGRGINVCCCSHHYHAIILKYTKRLLKPQKWFNIFRGLTW